MPEIFPACSLGQHEPQANGQKSLKELASAQILLYNSLRLRSCTNQVYNTSKPLLAKTRLLTSDSRW